MFMRLENIYMKSSSSNLQCYREHKCKVEKSNGLSNKINSWQPGPSLNSDLCKSNHATLTIPNWSDAPLKIFYIKGTVQRKLRSVESGVNQQLVLQCCGAGYYFLILKGHHVGICKKRFSATRAQIIGNVGKNQ